MFGNKYRLICQVVRAKEMIDMEIAMGEK